jgi:hypothetical protein
MAVKNVTGYLKWGDTIVGEIINRRQVRFVDFNTDARARRLIDLQIKGAEFWDANDFTEFLSDRIVSPGRRDIERILARLNCVEYDAVVIAEQTRAINPKDLFWIARSENETFKSVVEGTLKSIFKLKIDKTGGTASSPDGQNIKDYGISNNKYGILKQRLSGVMTDCESEVAVYKLGVLLDVDVCPAWFVDSDTIFSQFQYNYDEYLVHARHFFKPHELSGDRYEVLIEKFPEFKREIAKMCLLDFITRQDDRHLSNFAVLLGSDGERFYHLYDNGRSLFFEDRKEFVADCCSDVVGFSTSFGEIGTYYDAVKRINKDFEIGNLINLNVNENDIEQALMESGFEDYRLDGAFEWICKTMDICRRIDHA